MRISLAFACLLGLPLVAFAEPLAREDARSLMVRAASIGKAFDSADIDVIVELTHPSLYQFMGGKEKMKEITKAAMAELRASGAVLVESKLSGPGEAHPAGAELVCFCPRTTVIAVGGKKVRSTSFLICIRKAEGGPWLFLDGAALRTNPELLPALLPDLPINVPLPENTLEILE